MIVVPDAFAVTYREEYVQLAARYRLPTAYGFSTFARAGGLLAYSLDVPDHFRRAAQYVDRILRGASPGGLPVQAPTKFEFIMNMRAADMRPFRRDSAFDPLRKLSVHRSS
jgi:putative ABC transport system substrate-binding protein